MTIQFEREIIRLKKSILFLGSMVEDSLDMAMVSISEYDCALAQKIIDYDKDIDLKEIEIEEDCLKILALHQPVAIDLRFVISVLKINNDLERIGDLATSIAERILKLTNTKKLTIPQIIFSMATSAKGMVKNSLDALVNMDSELAEDVIKSDNEVDRLHSSMYDYIYSKFTDDLDKTPEWMEVLAISRYLERIADHATNIAEDVIYLINGKIVRHPNLMSS
ncbi:MAG: phosphate signaling complex protein PhoU [Candidatus Marinimicrobia bacterium]|nr:phosphate signaling complex protein PhoU [Candidatus Neomarinimicrobiota bacterium]